MRSIWTGSISFGLINIPVFDDTNLGLVSAKWVKDLLQILYYLKSGLW